MSDQESERQSAENKPGSDAYEPPSVEDIATEDGPAFAAPLVTAVAPH